MTRHTSFCLGCWHSSSWRLDYLYRCQIVILSINIHSIISDAVRLLVYRYHIVILSINIFSIISDSNNFVVVLLSAVLLLCFRSPLPIRDAIGSCMGAAAAFSSAESAVLAVLEYHRSCKDCTILWGI